MKVAVAQVVNSKGLCAQILTPLLIKITVAFLRFILKLGGLFGGVVLWFSQVTTTIQDANQQAAHYSTNGLINCLKCINLLIIRHKFIVLILYFLIFRPIPVTRLELFATVQLNFTCGTLLKFLTIPVPPNVLDLLVCPVTLKGLAS